MSKRISNSKGRTAARFGRVRIGWKKKKILTELEKIDKAEREGGLEEDMLVKFNEYKQRAKKNLKNFFPSRLFRHQSR